MRQAKPGRAAHPAARPAAETDTVTVRMYKGLLGDCFLLQLGSGAGRSNILIDCGVLQGIAGASDRMKAVASDIVAATGGHLDLLVVTHEHWDHISGFAHAADVFLEGGVTIDTLWMGWTENDADPQARGLRDRFEKAKVAVAAAAGYAVKLADQGVAGAAGVTAGLEAFIGPVDAGLGATGRRTGRQILQDLKIVAGKVAYLEPGQILATPGKTALRAHVLGPPRSEARLFKPLPSAGDNKETYLGGDGLSLADNLRGAIALQEGETDPDIPFPKRYRYTLPETPAPAAVAGPPAAAADDDGPAAWLAKAYIEGADWRRIDADWLGGAGALALKLDSNTNNTSLVLGFETPAGRVLLFAADAQVGNWLSWYDQTYPPAAAAPAAAAAAPATVGVTAEDLLARTVVYKVGHHGSHNATLDALGLDKMTSPDLVAFIPVVETDAHAQGGGWNMPFPAILSRLMNRSQGRVLRGDAKAGCGPDGAALTRDPTFLDRVSDGPDGLFVEYRLPPSQVGAFPAV